MPARHEVVDYRELAAKARTRAEATGALKREYYLDVARSYDHLADALEAISRRQNSTFL